MVAQYSPTAVRTEHTCASWDFLDNKHGHREHVKTGAQRTDHGMATKNLMVL